MLARIRSFRGIVAAELEIKPVVLIAGKNHQGKSSIAQAVAAALTKQPVPFFQSAKPDKELFNKTDTKQLVNDSVGAKEGGIRLEDGESRIQIGWPGQEVTIKGEPPACSKVAAGLVTPIDMGDVDRANFFTDVLKSAPSKEDFLLALANAKYPVQGNEKALAAIWESIDVSGWDAVHKRFREDGTKAKGAWERVAGIKYGSEKAANFKPAGYDDTLEDQTLEQLAEAVANARQKVEDLVSNEAVADGEIARLAEGANREAELTARIDTAKAAVAKAKAAYQKAEETLKPLRAPHVFACQHCGGMNKITFQPGGTFTIEPSTLTDKDMKALDQQRAIASKQHEEANKAYGDAQNELRTLQAEFKAVAGSTLRLEQAKASKGGVDGEAVASARDELRTHEGLYLAKRTYDEAKSLHDDVVKNQIIIDVLEASGLRREKLQQRLTMLNTVLQGYCKTANYAIVKLTPELEVTLGNRHYVFLSDSEKYFCRAMIQVAAAVYEGSNIVVLDGADILDSPSRNGLFVLLKSLAPAFHAVICMTFGKPDTVPDLEKAGMGKTYWIEAGQCGPLPTKAAA